MAADLSCIVSGVRIKPPTVVIYGMNGIGKTRWAAGAPSPIFLFTEEGQGKLDIPRFELRKDDPVLRSWEEILGCLDVLLEQPHDYGTVVIDTLDLAEPLLWDYTARMHNQDSIEGFGYGKGYRYACDEARVMLFKLDQLRTKHNMAVVLVCHSETKKFEAPDLDTHDQYRLRLQEQFGNLIRSWCDCLFFANLRTHIIKEKQDWNRERKRAIGSGERVLYTEQRPAFWAKNRYDLPSELPFSWQAFQDAIAAPQPVS